ncbi:MAG: sulfur carrier protein ThiS [Bacteroides sp.]|nr:sulfur carrier protein ThiS [Bacteroides sp.]
MKIKLNDKHYEVEEGITLAAFIEKMELKPQGIAIAIDDEVVSKNNWSKTILSDGMDLMLIHAVSGG